MHELTRTTITSMEAAEWCGKKHNELLKDMDKERYKQSNQQFEEKYMRLTQLMNYQN